MIKIKFVLLIFQILFISNSNNIQKTRTNAINSNFRINGCINKIII